MLAALLITASLAAPTSLTDHGATRHRPVAAHQKHETRLAERTPDADPNSPDHTPSFVEQYLSYQVGAQALPPVKDGLVMGHVLGYVFSIIPLCGTLWGPIVAVDGAEFSGDVFVTWLLSSILWVLIASVATFTAVGALVWLGVPYLQSTATFNALDRQMKAKGYKGPDPSKTTTSPPTTTTTPPPTSDTPPPSYAY